MSVYLAQKVPAKSTSSHFRTIGVEGYVPTQLSNIKFHAIPRAYQVAYAGYKENIAIFVGATSRQVKLSVERTGVLLNLDRPSLPLRDPVVGLISHKHLLQDEITKTVDSLKDYGCFVEKEGKTTVFHITSPTPALCAFMDGFGKDHIKLNGDYISKEGYEALLYLRLVAAEFLATNTYPAFSLEQTDSNEKDKEGNIIYEDDDRAMQYTMDQFVNTHSHIEARVVQTTTEDTPTEAYAQALTEYVQLTESLSPEEAAKVQEPVPDLVTKTTHTFGDAIEAVHHAKPSPIPASLNYGPPGSVPSLPGRAFPYFPGMMLPDRHYLKNTFFRLFNRLLGEDTEAIKTKWVEFDRALGYIYNREEGMQMAHLYFGINLALETQTRLYAVIADSEYLGFVLLGVRWSIHDGVKWLEPEDSESLDDSVADMSSHESAVRRICKVLQTLDISDEAMSIYDTKEKMKPENIPTSGYMIQAILSRKLVKGSEAAKEISSAVANLRYRAHYRHMGIPQITWAMEQLTIKSEDKLSLHDDPVYINPSLVSLGDKMYQVLASFGPEAFSFISASGNAIAIPVKPDGSQEAEVLNYQKALADTFPQFIVARKPILVAYADMKRTLEKKEVVMQFDERAVTHRCSVFRGKERDEMVDMLARLVGPVTKKITVDLKGKRKADAPPTDVPVAKRVAFSDLLSSIPKKN